MEKTNQTPDPELDALKGKVPGLEDDPAPEPTPAKEEAPKKEETPTPKKDEEPTKEPEPKEDEEEEEETPAPKSQRPEKYIPVAQYTSEKKSWKESEAQYKERITILEAAKGPEGSKKTEDAIKAYAEKYSMDEEGVRELVSLLTPPSTEKAPEKTASFTPEQQEELDRAAEITANQAFHQEFKDLAVPELKNLFPNATPEQLEKAREEVEKLATTRKYLDKPLDFVIYKERDIFAKMFDPGRKGPESSRQAPNKGAPTYTASDFQNGKTSFEELTNLPVEDQTKIVESMDLKTYEAFANWNTQNAPLVLNRGGRKVK